MDLNSIMVVLILLSTSTSFLTEAASARHHPSLSSEYTKHNSHHSSKHHASSHGTSASRPEPQRVHAQSKSSVEAAELQAPPGASAAVDYDEFGEGDLLPRPGTYIPSNCSSCIRREELRKRNLEVIKDQILSKLGLMSAPNMTGRTLPKIPLHLELPHANMQGDAPYNQGFTPGAVYDDEDDDFHARTEKVIAFTQPAPDHVQAVLKDVVYFKFTDKVLRSKVDKALLWIYLRPIDPASIILTPENETWVTTYKVCIVKAGESPVISKVRLTRFQLSKHGGWVYLEVKKVVAEWFKHPEDNLGFILQVSDPKSFTFVREAVMEGDAAFMPFMEVTTTEGGKVRKKRTIGLNCNENSEETRCCRYPLTVDFEEFGWDWIIAPKRYEANYCSGECPYVFLQKYPHTHIVQQANPAGTAGPCCAPRRMSPISMLYFDHEYNIIYGVLPGMVVDRCGCS